MSTGGTQSSGREEKAEIKKQRGKSRDKKAEIKSREKSEPATNPSPTNDPSHQPHTAFLYAVGGRAVAAVVFQEPSQ